MGGFWDGLYTRGVKATDEWRGETSFGFLSVVVQDITQGTW